jgi:hypothetical protein
MGAFGEIVVNVVMFPLSLMAAFRGSFNRFELEQAVHRLCSGMKKKLEELEPEITVLISHLVEARR